MAGIAQAEHAADVVAGALMEVGRPDLADLVYPCPHPDGSIGVALHGLSRRDLTDHELDLIWRAGKCTRAIHNVCFDCWRRRPGPCEHV